MPAPGRNCTIILRKKAAAIGQRVVLREGAVVDVDSSGACGDAATVSGGRLIGGNGCCSTGNGDFAIGIDIDGAAVLVSRVAGKLCAAIEGGVASTHIDAAAVAQGDRVVGDARSGDDQRTALAENRTAFPCCRVCRKCAVAIHRHGAANDIEPATALCDVSSMPGCLRCPRLCRL